MPIINGQKMACAPCIRGHRSTKCNHFYDRVMVPVRKPGRPLSTCPCPPGRPCACGGVRVAIPKKQKCGCSTGAAAEPDGSEKEHSPSETPTSPSRSSFRVSKPNSASKTGTRKQSFDLANLERMHPAYINLIAATNSNGPANGIPIPAASGDFHGSQTDLGGFVPGLGIAPAGPGSAYTAPQMAEYGVPMPYGLGLEYTQPSPLRHGIKTEETGPASPSKSDFGAAMPPPPFPNRSPTPASTGSQQQPAMLDPPRMSRANGIAPRANSCCGDKADASAPHSNKVRSPQGYEQYMPQFEYPTIFTYPGEYGSWQHPINPAIWQQVVSQTSMPARTSMMPVTNGDAGDAGDAGTSHQCSCGEGCQCVGCLAHPFNDQMFQYVNNAYSGSNGSSPGVAEAAGTGGEQQASPAAAAVAAGQDSPPPDARTPSDGSPEQSLSTLDYFFVNLPIRGLCGGQLGSCPCGESCDCPGCLVHGVSSTQG